MMATTHALAGVALATVALFVAPDLSPVAVAAAAAGGIFPDLDLYAGHRKTLHFPVYYPVAAAGALAIAVVMPTTVTIAAGFFLLAAAVHSVMDIFGGGLELKPWLGQSDRAVYSHFGDTWLAPQRWVRYDGAPEDFMLGVLFAAPALVTFDGPLQTAIVAVLAVSGVYSLLRKRMVTAAEWLVARLPRDVLGYVPERFVEDLV
ncbi:metal-dependent hydrolase [Halobacteriaceae archaeon GCM10025711]